MGKGKHHHKKSKDKKSLDAKSAPKGKEEGAKKGLPNHLLYLKGHDLGDSDHPKFLHEPFDIKPNRYNVKELSYLLQKNADERDASQFSTAA
jgi:hypothetical protein